MEQLIEKSIEDTLSDAFLEYAGYNLQRRAIPDVRDGLKWGARQLLHAQMLGKFTHDKPFKKAIKSVSQSMGFSYVHGETSAYGTFIRMAKPFVMNVPLQEAVGNYGTLIDPDDHSASRYVEMRGSEAAAYLLKDLNKDTIDEWEDTYDLEGKFPKVLPAKGFWGLVNGCISIGSGMSCSVPPMNLKELNKSLIKLLWNPDIDEDEILVLPDFPTGGIILNSEEIKTSLKNGTGPSCRIRAKIEYDFKENCFIVKEIPYSTYTNTICSELAKMMEENENCGIKDFVDYTGEKPDLRIYLTKNANPDKVLRELYKNTSLQTFYSINMILLDKGKVPRVFGLREAMLAHLDHEKNVYRNSFNYDLNKIKDRLHIIEGILIVLAHLEEVIEVIKNSQSAALASKNLQEKYLLDEEQAKAVLAIKLSQLARLEVKKYEDERDELLKEKKRIENILNTESLFNKEIENGLLEVAKKFGDDRRTLITNIARTENDEVIEQRVPEEDCIVVMTESGLIKRIPSNSFKVQKRNGAGIKTQDDITKDMIRTNTIDNLMLFTNKGKVYRFPVEEIPIGTNSSRGVSIKSLVELEDGEIPTLIYSIYHNTDAKYILFTTKKGIVKKTALEEYIKTKRRGGIAAITLRDSDELVSISLIKDEQLLLITKNGMCIRIKSTDIGTLGRTAIGVKGISLKEDDEVVQTLCIKDNNDYLAVFTENGLGKRMALKDFSVQAKAGKGILCYKPNSSTGKVIAAVLVDDNNNLLIVGNKKSICIAAKDISLIGRTGIGVSIIKDEHIKSVSKI